MFFKKNRNVTIFKLSNDAVEFIKNYLLSEFNITTKITMDILDDFISVAFDWESLMVDENGYDKTYPYPNKERNEQADRFVTEVSGKLASNKWIPDLDDLNKRLGLI